jgi:hypothetical protein
MDFDAKKPVQNPYKHANPVSKVFFLWIVPLFFKGARNPLNLGHLYDPLKEDISTGLGDRVKR